MLHTLENDILKITSSEHGGELHNITSKVTNTEYLWNGDAAYWKYHAPILFPIVGKVKAGKYRSEGNTYELPQHGLARVQDFKIIHSTSDMVIYMLSHSEETLKVYPYKFNLYITYELIENTVKVTYDVENVDSKIIYFSIGAHPAFMCPLKDGETMEDYYFEFNEKETASLITLDTEVGLISHNRLDYLKDENIIPLKKDIFKNDALIFDDLNSNIVSLKSRNHNQHISFDFDAFPQLGLWSMPTGAPFVCIEPWFGHADFVDFEGDFSEKAGVLSLEEGMTFTASYSVTVNE